MQKNKKAIILLLLFVALLIIIHIVFTAVSIIHYGKRDEKTHCDTAIVLGAATWNGKVSPVYRERLNHGIWLYENGYVDSLVLTGGVGEGNSISDAETAKRYAISQSVPEQAILIEEASTITEENLEFAKDIMDENGFYSAIIVSDPLHMKRAMLMAKDYGIDAYASPTPTTMYQSLKTKIPFLAREVFFYTGYTIVRIFR